MPRVKLIEPSPEETKLRKEIGSIMCALHMNTKQLADAIGVNYSTMKLRLSKDGISGMRMSEYWAIQELGRRRGVI